MCQFHESHSMFLPLVCNKLVKSPTPFFPILSIARSPKLWELFRFPTNVIYSLRDRRYIFETIQLSKWSLLICSFRLSLCVKLVTQKGQLSIFLLDLTLGGDGSDRFHQCNHTTCCDSFKSSEYGSLLKINTEAAEQTNSVIRITTSTTYPMLYLRSLKLFLLTSIMLPIKLDIKSLPMMLFSSLINSVPVKGSHQKKLVFFRNIS